MSEQNPDPQEQTNERYSSQIDPAFAEAWNDVFNEETPTEGAPVGEEGTDPGTGTVPEAPAVESGGQADPAPATGEPAAAPTVPDAGQLPGSQEDAPAGGTEDPAASGGRPAADPASVGTGVAFADISPLFDAAQTGLNQRIEDQFQRKALQDIEANVAPEYLEALQTHPRLLVGESVPSVKKDGETEYLKDEADAISWQASVKHVMDRQVQTKTKEYITEAKPFLSTLQESVEMFRRNPDLVPGTREFNPELANQFTRLAKAYEYRVNEKLVGYRVEVQPLITALREQLKAAPPATPTPRQEQAAQQPRTETGQFDGPQAGIPSQAGHGGEPEDDYSAFWGTVGMTEMNF